MPDAILEIRYYSTYNFVGDRIDGYEEPLAFLTKEAAALKDVSDELVSKGFSEISDLLAVRRIWSSACDNVPYGSNRRVTVSSGYGIKTCKYSFYNANYNCKIKR